MKARKNPTMKQLLRRFRRHPFSERDPRYEKDPYWALRLQGHPHSYAKRVFRDVPPKIIEVESTHVSGCDPEDILFPPGTVSKRIEVEIRPPLTADAIASAQPRDSEYTIWDHKIHGLGLRVRKSGYKSFILLKPIKGQKKKHKVTIGNAKSILLENARDIAWQHLADTHSDDDFYGQ